MPATIAAVPAVHRGCRCSYLPFESELAAAIRRVLGLQALGRPFLVSACCICCVRAVLASASQRRCQKKSHPHAVESYDRRRGSECLCG